MEKRSTQERKSETKLCKRAQQRLTIGLDLGDRSSRFCILESDGDIVREASVATTKKDLNRIFGALQHSLVAVEAGTHSPWVSRHLKTLGHEVIVANPRRTRLIANSSNKNDRIDAETLARLARVDPNMLFPIRHRGETAQTDLAVIRARAALVEGRTRLINAARGLTKSFGERLRTRDARYVDEKLAEDLPGEVRMALEPLLEQVRTLSARIHEYDEKIGRMARERYPETELLTAIGGVGVLIAYVRTYPGRCATIPAQPRRGAVSGNAPPPPAEQ